MKTKKIHAFGLSLLLLSGLFACNSAPQEAAKTVVSTALSTPVTVQSDTNRIAHSVYLTQDNTGLSVMVWTEQAAAPDKISDELHTQGEKYFFFARFDEATQEFTAKTAIPIVETASLHAEGMPKLAFKKSGAIIAVYEVSIASEKNTYAGEIHYIVSKDDGATWSQPRNVHTSQDPDESRGFFDMLTLADGEVGVTWLGASITVGRPILFAKTNAANEFVNEIIVDSSACECCRTAIYADEYGTISLMYRAISKTSVRDISVALSEDGGANFSRPISFSGDNWNINACPHKGPDVVSDQNNIYAVWYTGASDNGVYFSQLDKSNLKAHKQLISKDGRHIQIATHKDQVVMTYDEDYAKGDHYYSRIKALSYPNMEEMEISTTDAISQTPTVIMGENATIIAWIESNNGPDVVKYAVL